MKLYTKTGDDGTTGLFGGDRVDKDHPRVESYGAVDELNACLGVAAAACAGDDDVSRRLLEILRAMQSRLFDIGADLATPPGTPHESKVMRVAVRHVEEVEGWIDEVEAGNAPLTQFILPGGGELSARLHLARAVCRRAERRIVNLRRSQEVGEAVVHYVNRVGDLLFAMARRANAAAGVEDVPWEKGE